MPDNKKLVVLEMSGEITPDLIAELQAIDTSGLVDVMSTSGLNAERGLQLIMEWSEPAYTALKKVLAAIFRANQVTGIEITRDSVKVGSMNSNDTEKVSEFITQTLDQLHDNS